MAPIDCHWPNLGKFLWPTSWLNADLQREVILSHPGISKCNHIVKCKERNWLFFFFLACGLRGDIVLHFTSHSGDIISIIAWGCGYSPVICANVNLSKFYQTSGESLSIQRITNMAIPLQRKNSSHSDLPSFAELLKIISRVTVFSMQVYFLVDWTFSPLEGCKKVVTVGSVILFIVETDSNKLVILQPPTRTWHFEASLTWIRLSVTTKRYSLLAFMQPCSNLFDKEPERCLYFMNVRVYICPVFMCLPKSSSVVSPQQMQPPECKHSPAHTEPHGADVLSWQHIQMTTKE